ncbi:CRISPR-associated protein Cas7 [Algivirga pacifica]|uniref:CRISPR-associated protein Cas7 n=1 Tax=Algivirga pacifica TaxID=1162670 RepID=A0ABP9DI67_9BACT
MQNHTIYIRTLKRAEHTVFCVEDGQKTYYDPQFKRMLPYASGQQVKRSLLDSFCDAGNIKISPTTFYWDFNKKKELKEGEAFGTCDPTYPDQLIGGWMKASKGGGSRTLKRRSPLSVSAMKPLHPLLAGVNKDSASFDRSGHSHNKIIVRGEDGKELNEDEINTILEGKDRSLTRKWIPASNKATGLFIQDIAIDLRRLFSIRLDDFEPEISQEVEEKLRESGWVEGENVFGRCLIAPVKLREKLIPILAYAIINWKITSNQARTFSLMETLAVSIGGNANKIAGAIRAKLSEENSEQAIPVVEEQVKGIDTFVTPTAAGYVATTTESIEAMDDAEEKLIEILSSYAYEALPEFAL